MEKRMKKDSPPSLRPGSNAARPIPIPTGVVIANDTARMGLRSLIPATSTSSSQRLVPE